MIRNIDELPSFRWATVRGVAPLSIQLDGDPAPLALIPDSLVDPRLLVVGDRVRVELSLRKVVIHGKSNGAGGTVEDWTNLQGYLAPGITYLADGDSALAGIRARRVGLMVELSLGNFVIDSIAVPTDGNVGNRNILTNIPERFRPAGGASIGSAWYGKGWAGFARNTGGVVVASITPSATQTGTTTFTDLQLSGTATYPAATL